VIGYLSGRSSESDAAMLVAFRRGLNESGYFEGQNLAIEYRFADGQYDRLPSLLRDITDQQVGVIVVAGFVVSDALLLQMRASQIPIVFNIGSDPVRLGLVSSMNRPGGNITGFVSLVAELTAKQIGVLREVVPSANTIVLLQDRLIVELSRRNKPEDDARAAADTLRMRLIVLNAYGEGEIEAAFKAANQQRADAIVVTVSPFFLTQAKQIVSLAGQYRVPAIYVRREYAEAGGLMSYGYDIADLYREMGHYAGRILKGEKPANLPVFQPTRFEFVINLKTAKALGLTIPPNLLALADEVIE
jgi:putative tryptophan/tyrosine transport system substrate-binding protein